MSQGPAYIAFDGDKLLIEGDAPSVALAVRSRMQETDTHQICIFERDTSRTVEFDMRGSEADMLARIQANASAHEREKPAPGRRGPGRPKLGVTSREITLLPRHWDWLAAQPGGASVTLRRLVEDARRNQMSMTPKAAREIVYRFMTRMAGDKENFEEASRALFAGDRETFDRLTEPWPWDIYAHLQRICAPAFSK